MTELKLPVDPEITPPPQSSYAALEQQLGLIAKDRAVLAAQLTHISAVAKTCLSLQASNQDPSQHLQYIIDLINSLPVQRHMGVNNG